MRSNTSSHDVPSALRMVSSEVLGALLIAVLFVGYTVFREGRVGVEVILAMLLFVMVSVPIGFVGHWYASRRAGQQGSESPGS